MWSTAREALHADTLGRCPIPVGTILILSPWLQHHRPASWPEPDTFDPNRFLKGRPALGDYFPFGFGPRACLGKSFAHTELLAFLAATLQVWRLTPPSDGRTPEVRLTTNARPANGVDIRIESR